MMYLLIKYVEVAGIIKSANQCNEVVKETARPFTDAGNISVNRSHVTGPSPKEYAVS
jgi:hypothetical protein